MDGARRDVRLTHRDAVLVRSDVEIEETSSGRYDAALRGKSIAILRGYCLADVSVGDATVTVANTILESVDDDTRTEQATELL